VGRGWETGERRSKRGGKNPNRHLQVGAVKDTYFTALEAGGRHGANNKGGQNHWKGNKNKQKIDEGGGEEDSKQQKALVDQKPAGNGLQNQSFRTVRVTTTKGEGRTPNSGRGTEERVKPVKPKSMKHG